MELADPFWFVGCGNMAGAMVEGWRLAGADLTKAIAIRPSGREVEGVRTVASIADAGASPKVAVLGIKPQKLDEVAPLLDPRLAPDTVVLSILAGVEVATLRQRLPSAGAIVRAMPNLPVAVRRGVVVLYGEPIGVERREQISQLFRPLGFAMWAASEAELAAIGSMAGAGPAYVARFIAALAKAGVQRGLDPEMAEMIALETVFGTAWLASSTRETMEDIAGRVASPNGTTQAGLAVLDREAVLDQLIAVAIDAAASRGAELAEEARARAQLAAGVDLP